MILAGTIGATKTVLALCNVDDSGVRVARTERFASQELASLDKALDLFLRERDIEALYGACFGVAGPVVDGVSRVTNLGWVLDAAPISKRFGITVSLINDLQATALGSLVVSQDKLVVLQDSGDVAQRAPIAVMALGTGLGEASLVHDGKRYRALPSEGGHADFAPATDDEIGLLRFLRGRHGHVSYERVLSSGGILDIYEYVRSQSSEREPTWLAHDIAAGDPSMAIVNAALGAGSGSQREDASCVRAIQMFTEMLGAEAGNIALRCVAGSVVIGGGIPHKLLPALRGGGFVTRFNDKGRFSRWTQQVGVRVLVEPRAGLLGAAHYAATSK